MMHFFIIWYGMALYSYAWLSLVNWLPSDIRIFSANTLLDPDRLFLWFLILSVWPMLMVLAMLDFDENF